MGRLLWSLSLALLHRVGLAFVAISAHVVQKNTTRDFGAPECSCYTCDRSVTRRNYLAESGEVSPGCFVLLPLRIDFHSLDVIMYSWGKPTRRFTVYRGKPNHDSLSGGYIFPALLPRRFARRREAVQRRDR